MVKVVDFVKRGMYDGFAMVAVSIKELVLDLHWCRELQYGAVVRRVSDAGAQQMLCRIRHRACYMESI